MWGWHRTPWHTHGYTPTPPGWRAQRTMALCVRREWGHTLFVLYLYLCLHLSVRLRFVYTSLYLNFFIQFYSCFQVFSFFFRCFSFLPIFLCLSCFQQHHSPVLMQKGSDWCEVVPSWGARANITCLLISLPSILLFNIELSHLQSLFIVCCGSTFHSVKTY